MSYKISCDKCGKISSTGTRSRAPGSQPAGWNTFSINGTSYDICDACLKLVKDWFFGT